jgi:hypothetical protein
MELTSNPGSDKTHTRAKLAPRIIVLIVSSFGRRAGRADYRFTRGRASTAKRSLDSGAKAEPAAPKRSCGFGREGGT